MAQEINISLSAFRAAANAAVIGDPAADPAAVADAPVEVGTVVTMSAEVELVEADEANDIATVRILGLEDEEVTDAMLADADAAAELDAEDAAEAAAKIDEEGLSY
jgi:hypothetical protein